LHDEADPMKVLTVFGTRPEIIRLSRILPLLDRHCTHVTVHTGQNYDERLSEIFLRELDVREPDVQLGVRAGSFATQLAGILTGAEEVLVEHRPDRVVVLGDTNSGLVALVAARLGIPVFHLEAGNRCYDDRVPEEINRRVIDHCSTVLMPYTQRSKDNLVREGIERERIFVIGNPIGEVLTAYAERIAASDALDRFGVEPRAYFLATLHRAENVDDPHRLAMLLESLSEVAEESDLPVLVSVHPRTRDAMTRAALEAPRLTLLAPLGFFDFVRLEQQARAVLSDSGTVQEECAIFGVPNVTIRDVTERPETIECGSNVLSGARPEDVRRALDVALAIAPAWTPPAEYTVRDVSTTVLKIVLGHTSVRRYAAGC
jgi:UDP-N-acetylglucosamine 2-epimerase (non-hydrolysing)